MEGHSQDRARQAGQPRRGIISRMLTLGVLAVSALMVLAACGPNVDKPYSTLTPASPTADDVQGLYKLLFWLSLVVFVSVQFAIIYLALRYKRRSSVTKRPPQIHGNHRLEIIWTIIPAIVLLILLIPTISTLYEHHAAAEEGDLVVDVYGKRWWWEFEYANDTTQGEDLDVWTANELYLPVGKNVQLRLQSNNVIHSFWVPQLSGKLDVIPGHVNLLSITPTKIGEYYGECAEYCGAQHAWMRFKINVVSEEDFYNWVNNWRTSPATTVRGEASDTVIKAPDAFSVCLGCHRVNGMEGSVMPEGITSPANVGPNLTMVACRETIGAGIIEMTPENLRNWLHDPEAVKPGNYMGDMIKPGVLSDEQIDELVDFIFSMKPEGGCTAADGWAGGTAGSEATPVASPVPGS
ncbi:MAG TPA: cytochrome c oxidase subunit II [Thermomicrobiales bacterium]|nr:cytochrome c oxidase subunit II [Thermomicrobiales bacterium]